MILRWEAPPSPIAPPSDPDSETIKQIVQELSTRPGEWAVVAEVAYRAEAERIRSNLRGRFCTVSIRTAPDRTITVYARFNGTER